LKVLSEQRQALVAEQGDAEARQSRRQEQLARLQGIQAWQERVGRNLDDLDYQGRRDALMALGLTMRVWRKEMTPRWEIEVDIDPAQLVDTTC
jgi:hypothetical protein